MTRLATLLETFAKRLKSLYGEGLLSVTLYGSATHTAYLPGKSNVNIAVVLTDARLANIAKAHTLLNERAFRDLKPVFFTERYILSSLDVFPIEFLDIQENHRVLYGKDHFQDLRVDTRHLRFQCEQEVKSKLVTLKSAYVRTAGRAAEKELLFRSFTSLCHIMRNLIRLKGKNPPYPRGEVIAVFGREFGIDTAPLVRVLEAREQESRLSYAAADALLADLSDTLERIALAVDAL